MKECPSCAMQVDEKSKVCPICSYEFAEQKSIGLQIIAIALIILVVLYFIF